MWHDQCLDDECRHGGRGQSVTKLFEHDDERAVSALVGDPGSLLFH